LGRPIASIAFFSLVFLLTPVEGWADQTKPPPQETGDAAGATTPTSAASSKPPPFCQFGTAGVINRIVPSSTPNYFFRTVDIGGHPYISYAIGSGTLALLSMETGKEYLFDGPYDPVPVGKDIISVPNPMRFYPADEILDGHRNPERIVVLNEKDFTGTYQSVGLLQTVGQVSHYRIVTSDSPVAIADYSKKAGHPPTLEMEVPPRQVCPGVDLKLPMLSKDGRMISGYDQDSGHTKIWRIEGFADPTLPTKCEQILDLGMGVSKTDFSYDGQQIAFHTTSAADITDFFTAPSSTDRMNSYVYDIKKKNLKKITQNHPGVNSYYPVWREDGTIVFSQITEGEKPGFVHVDPKLLKGVSVDLSALPTQKTESAFALGQLWSQSCMNEPALYSPAVITALSLDPQKCRTMVHQAWGQNREAILAQAAKAKTDGSLPPSLNMNDLQGLKENDLLAACPSQTTDHRKAKPEAPPPSHLQVKAGQRILAQKCSLCHADLFSLNALTHKKLSPSLIQEIRRRLSPTTPLKERMPQLGTLTEEDRETIEAYLREQSQ